MGNGKKSFCSHAVYSDQNFRFKTSHMSAFYETDLCLPVLFGVQAVKYSGSPLLRNLILPFRLAVS